MSYDDGSLGQRGNGTPADGTLWKLVTAPRRAIRRLRAHAAAWPRRYVEMQSALYDSHDEK
jgi:hypothetical protein